MAYHEMFDERILALQNELRNHPDILAKAQACGSLSEVLGSIAADLNILLDGTYDIPDLCGMLALKLRERGTIEVQTVYNTIPVQVKVGENEIIVDGVPNPTPLLPPPSSKKEE